MPIAMAVKVEKVGKAAKDGKAAMAAKVATTTATVPVVALDPLIILVVELVQLLAMLTATLLEIRCLLDVGGTIIGRVARRLPAVTAEVTVAGVQGMDDEVVHEALGIAGVTDTGAPAPGVIETTICRSHDERREMYRTSRLLCLMILIGVYS